MVVELASTFGVSSGVVNLPAPAGSLESGFVRHVRLGADNWLDALSATLFVKIEDPVHVAVVSHSESRLAVGYRLGDKFVKFCGAVEHGKLGMNMEMGERVAQHQPPNVSVEPNLFGLQISAMWFRNSSSGLEVSSWESGVVGTVS